MNKELIGKETSDEQLMEAVACGNHTAFTMLYQRYSDRIYTYFVRMLWKNKELAADKTQQIFLTVFEKAGSYSSGRSFKTWLFSMAHNSCKNEYRYYEKKEFSEIDNYRDMIQDKASGDAEALMDERLVKHYLEQLLETLDEETKNIFVLRYYEDLGLKEISELTGLPEGTIKSRIFYSLKKLNGKMKAFR